MHIRSAGEQRVRDLLDQTSPGGSAGTDHRGDSTTAERRCAPVPMRSTLIISLVLLVALILLLVV